VPEFKNTDRVHHEHYGYGDVLDVQGVEVTVLFDTDTEGVAERRLLSTMGRLRLVPDGEEEDAEDNRAADTMEQAVRSGEVRTVPVEEPAAPKPPVEEALTHLFAKGDEVAIAFKAGDEPIGRVAILRANGGYRVNLYSGGTMCFGPQELKLLRRDAVIPAEETPPEKKIPFERNDRVRHPTYGLGTVLRYYPKRSNCISVRFDNDRYFDFPNDGSVVKIDTPPADPTKPEPPPEPDPLIKRMDEEIARRGHGAMLAVTQAVGVTISMVYHWRRTQRIAFPDQRAKIQAWVDEPWAPASVDELFLEMEKAIAARPYWAMTQLAKALDVHRNEVKRWRNGDQQVPQEYRAGVRAWIDHAPTVVVKPKKETPVAKEAQPPPPDLPKSVGNITHATILRLLTEMGMTYTPCWVIENGELVKKEAWIMQP
jgi:hypothetical protein